ncbi:MAG TPA: cyclodeaminase/cyclohydrolase family protein [Rubrivivax sp.]|nr:cyclodeaminase/cyclohydrolase family protein [Rubrivivax sp.]
MAAMVANLSAGKAEFATRLDTCDDLSVQAQRVKDALLAAVDEDTQAFNGVMDALRLPKDNPEQQAVRTAALQAGYRHATDVPLATARQCHAALGLARRAAQLGNHAMITDAGTGALVALAGLKAAAYNVRVNLKSIKDASYVQTTRTELDRLLADAASIADEVEAEVLRLTA